MRIPLSSLRSVLARLASRIKTAWLRARGANIGTDTFIDFRARLKGREIAIGSYVEVNRNVRIECGGALRIGDCSVLLGSIAMTTSGSVTIGDYTTVYDGVQAAGVASLCLGENCWVGPRVSFDLTAPVTIGSNVGIGAESMLWTHGHFAPEYEGYPSKQGPLVVEDDVWITPRVIVSPDVTIGTRAIVNTAAVVTRDLPPKGLYAGAPARRIAEESDYRREVDAEERFAMLLERFMADTDASVVDTVGRASVIDFAWRGGRKQCVLLTCADTLARSACEEALSLWDRLVVLAVAESVDWPSLPASERLVAFDLAEKAYSKRLTAPEIAFKRSLNHSTARFVAREAG